MLTKPRQLLKLAAIPSLFLSTYAMASGIQLDTSYSSAGYAWAGRAALYDDASTGYYNPALYSAFCNPEVGLGVIFADVNPDVKMLNASIDATALGLGVIPTPGNDRASIGGWNVLAGLYAVLPITSRLSAGINVSLPWGLTFNYPRSSKSRYFAQLASLKVVDVDPGISFEVFNGFSVGAGLDALYSNIETKLAIPTFVAGPALGNDTYVRNENADRWNFGWNVGVLYRAPTHTSIGAGYHSKVTTTPNGSSSAIDGITGNEFEGRARSHFIYPAFFNVSIVQELSQCWALLADFRFTNWSKVKNNTIKFQGNVANVAQNVTLDLDWHDSYNASLGVSFKPSDEWKLKAGIGYDKTPVPNDEKRPFLIPDNDRYVLGLGAQYCVNKNIHLDAGYTLKLMSRAEMDATNVVPPITLSSKAKADTRINEITLTFNWTIT